MWPDTPAGGSGGAAAGEAGRVPERAVLVGVALGALGRERTETSLAELDALAGAAGAQVVGRALQERRRLDPATLVGAGKATAIAAVCAELGAELALFDDDLSPAQQRNLEKILGVKVLDRTQLILDIFAARARTREGRLQVELAQLNYRLPRLAGRGTELSRLGGGIGTRGPGETKLEVDRRRIRQRIQSLRRDIDRVRRERRTRREGRGRSQRPVVSLVGYTNAGKSTLFNRLTAAVTGVSSQPFMTLDPLVRSVRIGPGQEVLLVDTVGFIQKLPHALVAAFRATLEEVVEADLLIHVMDASTDDLEARGDAVERVLTEIGATRQPRLEVLNKCDRLEPPLRARRAARYPDAVAVSARTGAGVEALLAALAARLDLEPRRVRLRFRADDARGIAGVYASGRVVSHDVAGDEVTLDADLPGRSVALFRDRLVG